MPIASAAAEPTSSGFAYSRDRFRELVEICLATAKGLGASDAVAEVSEGVGLSVSVRKGETENIERNRDKSVSVTVYVGQRRGNASTSDFSRAALEQTVRAAHDIARFTAEDPAAGLPEEADLAPPEAAGRDLDLFHPWAIDAEGAIALAARCEAAALAVDRRITNSEGAGVSAQQSHFYTGNTRGFGAGYASSRQSLSVAPIASLPGPNGEDMQRDAWYSSMRSADELAPPELVGRYAAERALSRLASRKIKTCEVPVLFESSLASSLLGAYVQATSGGALYRKSSFLLDSLGKRVLPEHIDIHEDPHVPRGKGSAPFDDEGVATRPARIVDAGTVCTYFLSSYSARKLGMRTTGHAGGSHNLTLTSRRTRPEDDLDAMLRRLGRGLFVIELMGQGINYVTGDYSRGAAGFWVENGKISFPVHEVTIAGNLRTMFEGIVAVGADTYTMGSRTIGSVLIDRMKIAGA
jgi:PmbA protein